MSTLEMTALEPPLKIMQIMHSRWAVETLRSAVELGVFSKLEKTSKNATELSSELACPSFGVELLLNALLALGFLEKGTDGKFKLTPQSRTYLVKESQLYIGDYVQDERLEETWSNLTEAIRKGKPIHMVNHHQKAEEFFPKLAASIFPMNYGTAHSVANHIKVEQLPAGARVLDVAAGSGVWSLPLAERNKHLHVDALDFPAVLEVTKDFAKKHGVADRYSFISGNWSDCKLDSEKYDLVCLGHILHSEGKKRSESLLKESFRSLKKGGKIIVAEMISDDDRQAAVFPQLFALNMFLLTEEGCVFTKSELTEILAHAGFQNIEHPHLPGWGPESPVMIAQKK